MTRKTRINYHRKSQGKTDYKKRLTLLKSRSERLVIRRSNKYLIAQIVQYEPDGDKTIVGVSSKELQKFDWKNSCKNIPACYLTGLLLAKKANAKKISSAILDLGLQSPAKGSRLYAVLKGVIDGNISVPCSDKIFPPEERLNGKYLSDKISKDIETIKLKIKG
jgi:large subunit ribosomal protein L18